MSNYKYSIVDGNIGLVIDGEPISIDKSHRNYKAILTALVGEDFDSIPELADLGTAIQVWGKDQITVLDGQVFHNGTVLDDGALTTRILDMISEGQDCDAMVKFVVNLMSNPDAEVVPQVYRFLRANRLPITKDGCFLAYKRVIQLEDGSLVDAYTRKISNDVGTTVKEDRSVVVKDPEACCSKGLHACSWNYLTASGYASGGTLVAVKINPRDVVSVPTSYNDTKLRCCEYTVLEIAVDQNDPVSIYENKIVWDSKPEETDDFKFLDPNEVFADFDLDEDEDYYEEDLDDFEDDCEDYEDEDEDYGDVEPDAEQKHVQKSSEKSNFHNVRDSKGRFTKASSASSGSQPRDSKGRFMSWVKKQLNG